MKNCFQLGRKFQEIKQFYVKFKKEFSILSHFKSKIQGKVLTMNTLGVCFILYNLQNFNFNKRKLFCDTKDFPFLLNLSFGKDFESKFVKKKCPKIIYITSNRESADEKVLIEADFQKIHSKYKDVDSYVLDLKKNLHSIKDLEALLTLYGHSLQDLKLLRRLQLKWAQVVSHKLVGEVHKHAPPPQCPAA